MGLEDLLATMIIIIVQNTNLAGDLETDLAIVNLIEAGIIIMVPLPAVRFLDNSSYLAITLCISIPDMYFVLCFVR